MELLEKQGLCSQQQRQSERCASLPPSSLPRPKRNKTRDSKDRKLGEYGRLSDSEATAKMSNNSSSDTTDTRQRESPSRVIPLARKLGEYGRLGDVEDTETKGSVNSNSDSDSKRRDSPVRSTMRNYTRLTENESDVKLSTSSGSDNADNKRRDSPGRSMLPPHNYARLSEGDLNTGKNLEAKENRSLRESSNGLMLPRPPRKLGEYGRLSDAEGNTRKNSGTSSADESQHSARTEVIDDTENKKKEVSRISPVNRSPVRKTVEFGKQITTNEIRMTPANKYQHYDAEKQESRSLLPLPNLPSKLPTRSFLPPPKKLSEYGCFEQTQNKPETKLRFLPAGRRGSLHREQPQQKLGGVRSLPTPNKYRLQF